LVLAHMPSTWSASNDNNEQAPIRVLEHRFPSNDANQSPENSPCAPGQCPEPAAPRNQPLKKTPTTLTPKAKFPSNGKAIPERPAAKFIPPLPGDSRPYEANQLLLFFPDQAIANTRIQAIKKQFHLSPSDRTPLKALDGELVRYTINKNTLPDIKQQLAKVAPEAIVEFNYFYQSAKGPRQYFQKSINLVEPTHASNKIAIGIVDTAVEQVPALAHATIVQKSFTPTSNKQANTSHGTSVALLIAGKDKQQHFYGITPNSPLFVADVMRRVNKRNNTNSLLLVHALDWLVSNQVKVINLSLGGPKDAIMAAIFNQLRKHPVLLVAAAGNSGPQATPSYPAAYPGVIAVTATNANNQIYKHANRGHYIDLAAPGEDVWVPSSNNGQYVSGTSFSAALVSGIASLLISPHTKVNTNAIKQALCEHAIDLGSVGHDEIYGCGLLQNATMQLKANR
ncbi:MAG: S8 family serine peptidase, partial [Methylophilaceae bacterium]